ncbi:MAG TPA: J domain-containing protein [Actinomycetota bacterium]
MDAEPVGGPFDPYLVLGVSSLASREEIRHAYRGLARQLHPDANAGDPASAVRFAQATAAYELLRDDARRRAFDLHRAASHGPRSQRVAPAPTGNTSVRGPGARPAHRPRERDAGVVQVVRETDELAVLRTFVKLGVVAVVLFVIAVGILTMRQPPDCAPGVSQPCRIVESPSGG